MATQVKLRQLHEEVTQKWDDNAASIAAEQARALAAETTLTTNLATEVSDREAAITAEASSRSSADNTLQSNIDAEASSRASADTTLQSNIDDEETRATAAEGVLTANLATEVADREGAVTAEASARSSADTTLQSNIDSEEAARIAADSALETSLKGDVAESYDTLGKLEDKIQVEETRVDAILNAADADKDSFAEIVTLINSVDTENDAAFAGYVVSNDAALAAEEARAVAAEAAIQADVDQNEADCDTGLASASTDRAAIRSEVAANETARDTSVESVRAALQADVDQNEQDGDDDRAAIRVEFADADNSLESNLQSQIDSQSALRVSDDAVLQSSLDSMGFKEGSFSGDASMSLEAEYQNAFSGSLSVFINGLEAEMGTDYSIDGESLSVPDAVASDRVSFRYMYKQFGTLTGDSGGGADDGGGDAGGDGGGPLLADESVAYQNGWYASAAGDPRSAATDTPEEEGDWYAGFDAFMNDPAQYSDYE